MKKIFTIYLILITCSNLLGTPFITTWKTNNTGTSNSTSITIPTTGTGYNYDVDWNNDGTYDQFGITGSVTHDYTLPGTYVVAIKGNFPQIHFNYSGFGDNDKILSVEQWGTIVWSSMASAFSGCSNLIINATDAPNLTNVTDLSNMFTDATSMNQSIGHWNVSNVTNMSQMFYSATLFNQDISNWNVGRVTNMSEMFSACISFNQNVGIWNVINVIDMSGTFAYCTSFNQNISSWNVNKVNDMRYMFASATSFNQAIGVWDVRNVTNMNSMFAGATSFNQNLGLWNVNKVTNTGRMFSNAQSFNQNIGAWDVSKVTNMSSMFLNAQSFNQNVGTWNIANVTLIYDIFNYSGISRTNYDNILIAWDLAGYNNKGLGSTNLKYCAGQTARANLISRGWVISGDVPTCTTTTTSIKTGNWEIPSTWDTSDIPKLTDNVIIAPNHTVTITTNTAISKKLTFSSKAILKYASSTANLSINP